MGGTYKETIGYVNILPRDVVATGETHILREFGERAFAEVGLDYKGYVKVDAQLYRPAEVDLLVGHAMKAREQLGWRPSYTFEEMIREMVEADLTALTQHAKPENALENSRSSS